MKKLVILLALVAFLGVSAAPVQASTDSPKTEQAEKKDKKAKTTQKSNEDCTTKSSSCCKSKCQEKSKENEAPQKK